MLKVEICMNLQLIQMKQRPLRKHILKGIMKQALIKQKNTYNMRIL